MGNRNHVVRRRVAAAVAAALGAVMLGTSALAGDGSEFLVRPQGKVAGQGYAYFLARDWQWAFSHTSALRDRGCNTLTVNGQTVAYLTSHASGTHTYSCNVPAGRPVYVPVLSAQCSTYPGQSGGFGTSSHGLERCAGLAFANKGTTLATLDTSRALDMKRLLVNTHAFAVKAVRGNAVGVPPGSGRAAASGYGLLFTGLTRGKHTLHFVVHSGAAATNITFTIRVTEAT